MSPSRSSLPFGGRRTAACLLIVALFAVGALPTTASSAGPHAAAVVLSRVGAVRPASQPPGTGASSVAWQNITRAEPTPGGRNRAVFVEDPASKEVLLFGGYDALGAGWLGDTWTISGATWTQLSPASSPVARSSASAAYDPGLGGVVVFGGYNYYSAAPYYNDTWLFKDGNWTNLSGTVAPSPRSEASMAYDPALDELVLFGGTTGAGVLNDTWAYGGSGWTRLAPATAPPELSGGAMAYDASVSSLVLFGGSSGGSDVLGTWTFNGSWSELPIASSPGGEYLPLLTTLPNGTVLLGTGLNHTSSSAPVNLWELNGSGWIPIPAPNGPGPREGSAMTYDSTDGYPLLFGGRSVTGGVGGASLNDSWALDTLTGQLLPAAWSGVAPFTIHPTATVFGGARASDGTSTVTYLWSFGDGGTSTSAAPTHTYANAGRVPLDLALRDGFGLAISLRTNVSVDFRVTIIVAASTNNTLTFGFSASTANATAPLSYEWSFGDASSVSVAATPNHTYAAAGTYTVEVQVQDADGISAWANQSVVASVPTQHSTTPGQNSSSPASTPILEYAALAGVAVVAVAGVGVVLLRRRSKPPSGE
ncbi:MAG: PKD domain-containing protein [Thermoplasmata archaeon]|nr:PKD domain-containing protein [Thermoplasmata archaeon]